MLRIDKRQRQARVKIQRIDKVAMVVRIGRIEREPLAKRRNGFVHVPLQLHGAGELAPGGRRLWIERDGLAIGGRRFVRLHHPQVSAPQVQVSGKTGRIEPHGLAVGGNRFVTSIELPQRRAQVEMGLGIVGIGGDGPAIALGRGGVLLAALIRDAHGVWPAAQSGRAATTASSQGSASPLLPKR